jgi:radical SAM protein with 4Fe4S-binding SPASM domain
MDSDNLNYHSVGKTVFEENLKNNKFADYRHQWVENPRKYIVSKFPLHLDIESTNVCNLKCPYCAAAKGNWGNKNLGFMDFGLFKKIIDEASSEGCYCVKFSLRGEPMLHPKLLNMIKYTVDSGIIDCYFNTNGMLLTEDTINKIIETGLPRLSISIDGWDKTSFEKNRLGANYDIICKNIENLIKIRKKYNVTRPKLRIQTVMLPEIREHWDEYVNNWSDIADEIGFLDAREETPGVDHRGNISKGFSCPFLWQRMTILWDGTLLPCLMHGVDDFKLMSFGNVKNILIKNAWNSSQEDYYRNLHKTSRSHELEACDKCSYRAMEIKKLTS